MPMGSRKPIVRRDEQFADMEEALNKALASLEDANSRVQELLARETEAIPGSPNGSVEAGTGETHNTEPTSGENLHE